MGAGSDLVRGGGQESGKGGGPNRDSRASTEALSMTMTFHARMLMLKSCKKKKKGGQMTLSEHGPAVMVMVL